MEQNEGGQTIPSFGGMSGAGMAADRGESMPSVSSPMPRYKCHKEVWALKIAAIRTVDEQSQNATYAGAWELVPADAGYGPVRVSHEFVLKHAPKVGGYYVVYAPDGYKSYSPADVFESGYTRI